MKMTFVVTDASGPVGSLVAKMLLAAEHAVRLVESEPDSLNHITHESAEMCICSLVDQAALSSCFKGATGVYLALPSRAKYRDDFCEFMERVGDAYSCAVARAGVDYVVAQSSMGVDNSKSAFLEVWNRFERKLDQIVPGNVLCLRPAHFPENLGMEILPSLNILVGAVDPDLPLPIVVPADVAAYAAERLERCDFAGHQVRELLGPRDLNMREVARIIGRSAGRENTAYVQLDTVTMEQWLRRVGLPSSSATMINNVWALVNSGSLGPTEKRSAQNSTSTSLATFVEQDMALRAQRQ